jgi:flavin-dependent dehydrogenase
MVSLVLLMQLQPLWRIIGALISGLAIARGAAAAAVVVIDRITFLGSHCCCCGE